MKRFRVPVVQRPEYQILYEQYENLTFVHCNVYKWTPSVKQKLIKDADVLVELHGGPIYTIHEPEDRKHFKFIELFDFKFVQQIFGEDGKIRHLYIRTKKETQNGY